MVTWVWIGSLVAAAAVGAAAYKLVDAWLDRRWERQRRERDAYREARARVLASMPDPPVRRWMPPDVFLVPDGYPSREASDLRPVERLRTMLVLHGHLDEVWRECEPLIDEAHRRSVEDGGSDVGFSVLSYAWKNLAQTDPAADLLRILAIRMLTDAVNVRPPV